MTGKKERVEATGKRNYNLTSIHMSSNHCQINEKEFHVLKSKISKIKTLAW
jgi:hypothetical protein